MANDIDFSLFPGRDLYPRLYYPPDMLQWHLATTPVPPVNEECVEENGVRLWFGIVLDQVPAATKEQALVALRNHKGDVVNAIMELTMPY